MWLALLHLAFLDLPSAAYIRAGSARSNSPQYARVDGSIETVWQRPNGDVKGIFFFAHGCNHQAVDLFTEVGPDGFKFDGCARSYLGQCLGLPEEMRMRQRVRQQGYVVAAVSGGSGARSCWNLKKDAPRVKRALDYIRGVENLPLAPLVLMGGSSGGAFMGELVLQDLGNVKCSVPMISFINVASDYPKHVATMFVHMARDTRTTAGVKTNIDELTQRGVRTERLTVEPAAVNAQFLRRDGFGLAEASAQKVIAKFTAGGLLDDEGFLKDDPRTSKWRASLQPLAAELGGLGPDVSKLSELLNIAYGQHECVYPDQVLDFCGIPR